MSHAAPPQPLQKMKTLLMGAVHSGKTSMRSIIFAHWVARDTVKLSMTNQVEHSSVRFLGNLVLNLWDCGGQTNFVEQYLTQQERHVFSSVAVLIYVFDVEPAVQGDDEAWRSQVNVFKRCLVALCRNSPGARVFCLVHKMDLVGDQRMRDESFAERREELMQHVEEAMQEYKGQMEEGKEEPQIDQNTQYFPTSIWDESLYRAWSAVVYSLVPQVDVLQRLTNRFCELCEADEVVLFERQTFLTILDSRNPAAAPHHDEHRHEKVSNIIKQFKLCAMRLGTAVQSMEITSSQFTAFVDKFTVNTYVMVILSDKAIPAPATQMNIKIARRMFDEVIRGSHELAAVL
eukprot:Hpha_TRINITY_DN34090_c0_g1::TRINITY_DN34090_c0_g1_i1::g.30469::m.30469/K16185/RRAGA_B; Ras-related GTP-binding protein A/B